MPQEKRILNFKGYLFVLVGCAAAILLFQAFRVIYPIEPYRCADGWRSPSIGTQGACSHHGGVVGGDSMPKGVKFVCPLFGLIVFFGLTAIFGGTSTVVPKASGKYGLGYIADRAELIDQAIVLNRKIEFLYTKKDEVFPSRRTIKPHRVAYLKEGRNSTLCVVGYCFSRNSDRTFLLTRMSNVKANGA